MPDTPEQRAQVLCGELQFFTSAMFRNLEPQVISTIASAIREAETRAEGRERNDIINLLDEYMRGCEKEAQRFSGSDNENETDNNMYWRADGASDALEILIQRIRARGDK